MAKLFRRHSSSVAPPGARSIRRLVAAAGLGSLISCLCGCAQHCAWRGDEGLAYGTLNRSTLALLEIGRDPRDAAVSAALRDACAAFVFPRFSTGAFVPAESRNDGVLLVRDPGTGQWIGPAFYVLDEAPFAQRSATATQGLMVAVGCKALGQLYGIASGRFDNDARTSIPLDTISGITAYSCEQGHPRQLLPEGLRARPSPQLAAGYYQYPATVPDILATQVARNGASVEIQSVIARVTR